MFTKDMLITGKHATYLKFLAKETEENDNTKIFDRYIDVYMNAAILGYINGLWEDKDTTSDYAKDTANILLGAIQKERRNLLFIYQTILLLDDKDKLTEEERINRAFRDTVGEARKERLKVNMEKFDGYVRGGITYLYDTITKNARNKNEYVRNIKDFVDDFHNEYVLKEYNKEIVYDEV